MSEIIKDSASTIYSTMRREILNLTIVPGQQVNEADICARFKTSRTPVREAMKRLSSDGIITVIPYKGAYATLLNLDQIEQYIYMRNILESAVLEEFVTLVTLKELETLRYKLRLQKVMLAERAKTNISDEAFIERFYSADSDFHKFWFTSCKKELLWKIIKESQVQYRRYRMLDMVSMTTFESIVAEHELLFNLIEEKQIEEIKKELKKHLFGGLKRLKKKVTTEFSDYFLNTTKKSNEHELYFKKEI